MSISEEKRPGERAGNWRAGLRRAGPGPYAVADGRILTDGLEVVIATHCNLRCRACAYFSPVMPVATVPAVQIRRDLSALARCVHASEVRVLGGEPLLHPELVPVLQVIRAAGVSDTIRVITNGLLLPRMPAGFWSLINEVSVSMYPVRQLDGDAAAAVARTAEKHGVRLRMKYFHYFRESYSELGTRDARLVERIYRTCQMANVWRCNTVLNGCIYRCPQSAFLPSILHPPRQRTARRLMGLRSQTPRVSPGGSWRSLNPPSRSGRAPTVWAASGACSRTTRRHARNGGRSSSTTPRSWWIGNTSTHWNATQGRWCATRPSSPHQSHPSSFTTS